MSAIRKSEFAKLCNVSAPGVSQWISGGKIDGKAIVGEGRGALIDVDLARAQLKERLSTNERCGLNGLNTKLDDVPARRSGPALPNVGGDVAESAPAARRQRVDSAPEDDEDPGSVDAQLKTEKLEQNKILTRKLRTEERARDGIYMDTASARGTMSRIASEMMKIFEGALPDMASAQAAKFQISQRELLHQLRADFRAIREQLAAVHVEARTSTPETVETPEWLFWPTQISRSIR